MAFCYPAVVCNSFGLRVVLVAVVVAAPAVVKILVGILAPVAVVLIVSVVLVGIVVFAVVV